MKILSLKEGIAKLRITAPVDLECLSKVIEPGDLVSGQSERKIKLGGEQERQRVSKKLVYLTIRVTKLTRETDLRVQGEVVSGPDEIPARSAHTIEISPGKEVRLQKSEWMDYQIEQLKICEKISSAAQILVCVLDDEQANFAFLTPSGLKKAGKIELRLTKKQFTEKKKDEIKKVAQEISDIAGQNKIKEVVIASPLFWKDEVQKALQQVNLNLSKKSILANVSTGSSRAFNELLTNKSIERLIKENKAAKDAQLVDILLQEISKGSKIIVYGIDETAKAAEMGAVQDLLVHESLLNKTKDIIKTVEKHKGSVHIIEKQEEAGDKLKSLGGLAAILKYRLN